MSALTNIFEHLQLQNASSIGHPTEPLPGLPTNLKPLSKSDMEYQLEEDLRDDFNLAIYHYHMVWINVRRYVRQIWTRYCQGSVSLITATLTTSAAVDLRSRTESMILERFSGRLTEESIGEAILVHLRNKPNSVKGPDQEHEAEEVFGDEVNALLRHGTSSYLCLAAISGNIKAKDGIPQLLDPRVASDMINSETHERYVDHAPTIKGAYYRRHHGDQFLIEDGITRTMRTLKDTGKVHA